MLIQYFVRFKETIASEEVYVALVTWSCINYQATGQAPYKTRQQEGMELAGFKTLSTYDFIMVAITFIVYLMADN